MEPVVVFEPLDTDEDEECDNCGHSECICCEICSSAPCECCSTCGEVGYDCTCCYDCECSPCECGMHGSSLKAPWVTRGDKVVRTGRQILHWQNVWPEVDTAIDPVQKAADFYLLEAILSRIIFHYQQPTNLDVDTSKDQEMLDILGITDPKKRAAFVRNRGQQLKKIARTDPRFALMELERTASQMQEALILSLDKVFLGYVHMAVAGEVRHHRAIGGHELPESRDSAWSGWRDIFESVGPQALLDIRDLFLEMEDGSYGGEPWADAAYVLYQREKGLFGPTELLNAKIFIDRVFSLEHNGGALLDKVEWVCQNVKGWTVGEIKKTLDAHASNPPDFLLLARIASPPVSNLFSQYLKTGVFRLPHDPEIALLLPELERKPFFKCRYCSSDPTRGHQIRCWNRRKVEPGSGFQQASDSQVRWDLSLIQDESYFQESYPVGADFKLNLEYEGQIDLDLTITGIHFYQYLHVKGSPKEIASFSLVDAINDIDELKRCPFVSIYAERNGYGLTKLNRVNPEELLADTSNILDTLLRS